MVAMLSILLMSYKIAFIVNVMNLNDMTILAISEHTLPAWEYEDFILERYKQRLIEPVKDFLSVDSDWNSTLRNVVIETNNIVDNLTVYRSMVKGVKVCSGMTVLCYQFQFKWLLSIFNGLERNPHFITAIVDPNIMDGKNLQIFVDDIRPVEKIYGGFDMNKQVLKRLENKTEEIIIRIHCNYRCPESIQPILFIKAELLQNSRQKRETRNDEDCSNRKCCLKTRYFQFRNSGLEHIAAPDGFMMDFCDGICDQTLIPATNDRNALVQAMKISDSHFNPFKNKWVCCVPIKFTSVNVAEQYNNGMQRSIPLKNVKVAECGCVI